MIGVCAALGCSVQREAARFPQDWIGSWSGEVTPYASDGPGERFGMRLDVAPTGDPARLAWTITYSGSAGTQVRAYALIVRDAARGLYAVDEHNGIVLEQQWIGDAMYAWFDVRGSRLSVREQLVQGREAADDHIEVEIASARDRDAVATGPDSEVSSRPLVSVQRATLRRLVPER